MTVIHSTPAQLLPTPNVVRSFTDRFLLDLIATRKADAFGLCDQILATTDDHEGQRLSAKLDIVVADIRLATELLAVAA